MAAFQEALPTLSAAGIDVFALSTDSAEGAARTVRELGLSFPVLHGLPLEPTAAALGAFYEERRRILHAAAYLLGPDRRLQLVVNSSGAVGRLLPAELLGLVSFWDRDRSPGPPVPEFPSP